MTTMTDQLGRELAGRYRLEAGLGTGASAHVYLATDLRLRRRVAVKLLHAGLSGDPAFLRRFGAEAQAVAALHHPNILQVFDWGEEPEPFIVLEHCGGGSLRDLLDSGARLSVAQAAAVGAAAARGLAYAHRRGLVHRDVKPANILFDEDGGVRIADFGLARALAEAAWTEPAGAVLGTARYASPEQAEGRPLDERSDVYSLALVCYEAVTGRVPFSGETTIATLMARIGAMLPPAPELGPLAPILAQGAISEPLARLDADEMAVNLEMLGRVLAPVEPLPFAPRSLIGTEGQPAGPPPARGPQEPGDVTELGIGASSRPATSAAQGGRTPSPAGGQGALEPAGEAAGGPGDDRMTAPGGEAGDPLEPAGQRRRRRRRVGAAVAVLVLLAGAAAVVELVVLTRRVPPLVGVGLVTARAEVSGAGLRLVVTAQRHSTSVPEGDVLASLPAAGARVARGATVHVVLSSGGPPVRLPEVAGASAAAAVATLRRAHLVPRVTRVFNLDVPPGRVVATSPSTGPVRYGSSLVVEVSKGPAPVTLPAFASGTTWISAEAALGGLRLKPLEVLVYSTSVPVGEVIATSPLGGTAGVRVGSSVTVTVSRGPRLVAVPAVAGDTISGAVAALRAAGLVVTEQIGPPFATKATTTLPAPGAEVRPGSSVTLYVA